jgi:hypothetical protein
MQLGITQQRSTFFFLLYGSQKNKARKSLMVLDALNAALSSHTSTAESFDSCAFSEKSRLRFTRREAPEP